MNVTVVYCMMQFARVLINVMDCVDRIALERKFLPTAEASRIITEVRM
jgi:hypothetical protein